MLAATSTFAASIRDDIVRRGHGDQDIHRRNTRAAPGSFRFSKTAIFISLDVTTPSLATCRTILGVDGCFQLIVIAFFTRGNGKLQAIAGQR